MTTTRVWIRDLLFDGGGGSDGLYITKGGLQGWDAQPGFRREGNERQQAHGTFPSPGYLDQRLVIIEGECITSTPERQRWFSDRFSGLLNDGQQGRLSVEHQGLTLWADV